MAKLANDLRRCVGVVLLGWMQGVWPKQDSRAHAAIGLLAAVIHDEPGEKE